MWRRKKRGFFVEAQWDDDAKVWYVANSDVPGLAAEAATQEELADHLRHLVPELVRENFASIPEENDGIPLDFTWHRRERLQMRA